MKSNDKMKVPCLSPQQEYLKKYPTVGKYWIVNNQYLPQGMSRPAKSYYYIVNSEGKIFHHKDKKWRKKSLKELTTYWFDSQESATTYIKENLLPLEIFPSDDKGRYMLLDRMQQDCKYFIHHPHKKHLWSGNIEDQIRDMKRLYDILPEKPEWITMTDIFKYEKDMKKAIEKD